MTTGEIHIPAVLDEAFGVTNNEQGLHPKQYVRDILHDKLWPTITQLRKEIRTDRREERRKRKSGECALGQTLGPHRRHALQVREVQLLGIDTRGRSRAALFTQRNANSRNSPRNSGGNLTDDVVLPALDLQRTAPTHFGLLVTTNLLRLQTATCPLRFRRR
jgi:hypothetical protein